MPQTPVQTGRNFQPDQVLQTPAHSLDRSFIAWLPIQPFILQRPQVQDRQSLHESPKLRQAALDTRCPNTEPRLSNSGQLAQTNLPAS